MQPRRFGAGRLVPLRPYQRRKMNEAEELTDLSDLLEDEFEFEAATRVLPKAQMPSYPPVALPPPPAARKSEAGVWAAVIGLSGVFAIAAVLGAVFLIRAHHTTDADPDTDTATATATATDTPTATATATDTATAPAPAATDIEPLKVAPSATVHAAPAAPRGHGFLQTFAIGHGKTITVDGKPAGVGGSHVKVACGKHSIAVGSGRARSYDVPCNGSVITVGTPDGQ